MEQQPVHVANHPGTEKPAVEAQAIQAPYPPWLLDEVDGWSMAWEGTKFRRDLLPKNMVLVPGAALCFLYSTDGGVAWVESMLSNPGIGPLRRARALRAVGERLKSLARELGFKRVVDFATSNGVGDMARRLGMRDFGTSSGLVIDL